MQCSVCGSESTTFVQGISKKTGRPWKAYDCNEPRCKNEKGYANRTFSYTPNGPQNVPNAKFEASYAGSQIKKTSLEIKVDQILEILKANFPSKSTKTIEEVNEEIQTESETPF